MFALRRIIEGVKRNHLPLVMVFIDFGKTFDSINHKIMFRIVSAIDISKRLVEAIMSKYKDRVAKVVSPD